MRRPRLILFFPAQHLREKKRAIHEPKRTLAPQRTAGVELPVPECEDENIGDPNCACRTQQCSRGLKMLRNAGDQVNQGSDHGDGDNDIGGECKNPSHAVMTAAIGNDDGNQQKARQLRARANSGLRTVAPAMPSTHRRPPASLPTLASGVEGFCAHKVPAEERAFSLIQPSPRATTRTKDPYDNAMIGGPLD